MIYDLQFLSGFNVPADKVWDAYRAVYTSFERLHIVPLISRQRKTVKAYVRWSIVSIGEDDNKN
ncbi:hypothetical protein QTP88_008954 [Uroleucon formosanum]